MRKFLRRLIYGIAGLIALLAFVSALIIVFELSIDLSPQKAVVEAVATRALKRPVRLEGKLTLTAGLWPFIDVTEVRLGNPAGFRAGNIVHLRRARLRIGLIPLLRGRVVVRRLQLTGATVALEEDGAGRVNWVARAAASSPAKLPVGDSAPLSTSALQRGAEAFVVESVILEDIRIKYTNPRLKQPAELYIAKGNGKGAADIDSPTELELSGDAMKNAFSARIKVGALDELFVKNRAWMRVDLAIARTEFSMEGAVDVSTATPQLDVKASVQGGRLDSLGELLDLDLPPFKGYRAAAHVSLQKKHAKLAALELKVGGSALRGQGSIDAAGARPVAVLELEAPRIRLQDFEVGGWSPKPGEATAAPGEKTTEPSAAQARGRKPVSKLFSPDVLGRLDARLRVRAGSVLAGKDKLGSGLLEGELKDGRISVQPLKLDVPGGTFHVGLSLQPGVKTADARLQLLVKDYDIGVLARYKDPKTKLGGIINLDVDVTSTASSLDDILAHANGYLDISAVPQNLRSGVIDLWAVNLVAAVLTRAKQEASKLNCLVGRWTIRDGVLTPDVLAIDTSRIRICAGGRIDFNRRDIALLAAPVPKKPEFFSLATPFRVSGSFSDFELGVGVGGVVVTTMRFITSPLLVPLQRMAGVGLPEDGADICRTVIGPRKGALAPAPGCAEVVKQVQSAK